MKKLTTAILFIAVIAGSFSCKKEYIGEGPVTTKARTVSGFTGIDLQMSGNVFYTNSPDWKLEVTAKESIHAGLETKVVNGKLVIRHNNGRTYDNDENIRIYVSGPGVNSFVLNTAGNIYVENIIDVSSLYLRTSGSGSISLQNVITGSLSAESTMSGRITATGGSAVTETLKTGGSGKIDLRGVVAKNVTARTDGSGDITVRVTDKLEATIDGSGDIYFSGSPLITTRISGNGRLIKF